MQKRWKVKCDHRLSYNRADKSRKSFKETNDPIAKLKISLEVIKNQTESAKC